MAQGKDKALQTTCIKLSDAYSLLPVSERNGYVCLQGEALKGRVTKFDVWNERAVSHSSGLAVLFLGTGAGHPGEQR